jgi:exonuclease VII large subunit
MCSCCRARFAVCFFVLSSQVTSYPFLADYHHIATELMQLLPPQPDLAAATQAVQQQLDQQPYGQQQQQEMYPVPGMAQGSYYLEQQPYEQLQQLQQQPYQQLHVQQQQQMQAQMQMQAYASHPMQQQLLQQQMQQQMQQGYGFGRQVSTGLLPSTQPLAMTFLSTPCG